MGGATFLDSSIFTYYIQSSFINYKLSSKLRMTRTLLRKLKQSTVTQKTPFPTVYYISTCIYVNFKEIRKSYNKMFMITVSEYRGCRCDRIVKSLPSKDVLILIPRTCESRIAWHEEFRLQKLINI